MERWTVRPPLVRHAGHGRAAGRRRDVGEWDGRGSRGDVIDGEHVFLLFEPGYRRGVLDVAPLPGRTPAEAVSLVVSRVFGPVCRDRVRAVLDFHGPGGKCRADDGGDGSASRVRAPTLSGWVRRAAAEGRRLPLSAMVSQEAGGGRPGWRGTIWVDVGWPRRSAWLSRRRVFCRFPFRRRRNGRRPGGRACGGRGGPVAATGVGHEHQALVEAHGEAVGHDGSGGRECVDS